jgi:hypothetical protein
VIRAARYRLPLMLAAIGGPPSRFGPCVEEAAEVRWPYWAEMFEASARERGGARPTMEKFQAEIAGGSLYVGSAETVATKLVVAIRLARAQSIRPCLRSWTSPARTTDGDDRALRPRGDPARASSARRDAQYWRRT